MRPQQSEALNNFVKIIRVSDMRLSDKLRVLQYWADECWLKDDNLQYLEVKLAMKELYEAEDKK